MPLKRGMSCLSVLTLIFSVMGAPARAREKPPGAAQEMPKGYSMPSSFPLYSSPPFRFRDNRILIVVFKTTPEVLRELAPEPLLPNPASFMFIYIGSLNIEDPSGGLFNYLEAGLCIPVVNPATKVLGNYAVCLYLNRATAIAGGREIWGWPKKDAELALIEKDGEITGRVERFGTVLISLSGRLEKKVEPVAVRPEMPWFLQKIIPSPRKGAPPDVWQLVSSTNTDAVTSELWNCTAKLDLKSGPQDPLGNIKILGIMSAQFSVGGFTMDYGQVIHDYLVKK